MTSFLVAEDFFRHEYARLVAILARRVGMEHLEAIEDAVQGALLVALEQWRGSGPPLEPSAWLYRVASNRLLDDLRKRARRGRILEEALEPAYPGQSEPTAFFEDEIRDDLLRMLFVCCDERLPSEAQVVFSLKVLCGFDVGEIAERLFTTSESVYKRLQRARQRLEELAPSLREEDVSTFRNRLPAVHRVVYLLFAEGHLSLRAGESIRRELCAEAIRLGTILASHELGDRPETSALLALMYFHSARLSSRQDGVGGLVLLDEQDRLSWDEEQIQVGLAWLARSAVGDTFSRYHAEAAIAAEHCLARTFAATNWQRIVECYQLLETFAPSPLHRLGRVVALAEWQGPQIALELLESESFPIWLEESFPRNAVLADLLLRLGRTREAEAVRDRALLEAPTEAVRDSFSRRWARMSGAAG